MATDPNLMKAEDFAKVSEVDFVSQFTEGIKTLQEVIGLTRKIEKIPGQMVKVYRVTGELEDGTVSEGEDIPLSHYETEVADAFELEVKKYRKMTTMEAINDKGYAQAVTDTDDKMLKQIQGTVKKAFFDFLPTGTGSASGVGLKGALAQTWGQLKVITEDFGVADSDYIYMVNPLDIADYLEDADVTVQTAFGMTYVENFLGLYNVLVYSGVESGKVYGTVKNNLILYYTNPRNSELSKAFDFTTDATGYVGVHHDSTYRNLTTETVAICGIALYAELLDWIVVGTISGKPAESVTLSQKTMTLAEGESKKLSATVIPAEAGDPMWASSAESYATVDQDGTVHAVAAGSANITAEVGSKTSAACAVTVSAAGME